MENPHPNPYTPNNNHTQSSSNNNNNGGTAKKIFKSNSNKSNKSMSMSDVDSQYDSFHSPLRSPLRSPRSDDPIFKSPSDSNPNPNPNSNSNSNSKAIVAVDKYFSPLRSLKKPSSDNLSLPPTPPPAAPAAGRVKDDVFPPPPPPPMMMLNRAMTDGVQPGVPEKVEMRERDEERGDRRSRTGHMSSVMSSSNKEFMVNKAALGFRVSEVILCLISFSVMAADKTQGWSGDSFDRYREYRYLVAVNVIGFVYSGFQAYDLAYHLATAKHVISSHLRYFFDFAMDQVLAYLLMSASSASATRVDDWVSNWGKDEFTEMATASISISFVAFLAFAVSSMICGYSLCNRGFS